MYRAHLFRLSAPPNLCTMVTPPSRPSRTPASRARRRRNPESPAWPPHHGAAEGVIPEVTQVLENRVTQGDVVGARSSGSAVSASPWKSRMTSRMIGPRSSAFRAPIP